MAAVGLFGWGSWFAALVGLFVVMVCVAVGVCGFWVYDFCCCLLWGLLLCF